MRNIYQQRIAKMALMLICVLPSGIIKAQDSTSMLSALPDSMPATEKVRSIFISPRVIQSHSVEMLSTKTLDFRILHRFGLISRGADNFFGLDEAKMRMGFDYGICNNFTVGIGRSTYRKEYDAFVKGRLLQQRKGEASMPFSLVAIAGIMTRTDKTEQDATGYKPNAGERTSYFGQLLIGRKFCNEFSMQLSTVALHQNFVADPEFDKNYIALGGALRYKFSKRMAINVDYHHLFAQLPSGYYDPLSVGLDLETGGHVFQLHFSNSIGMNERAFLTETANKFFKGDIRFGFNLSRRFSMGKK